MLGHFEHLAETTFAPFETDLGERELDYILGVEFDLDMFLAAIGLAKASIEAAVKDEGYHLFIIFVYLTQC